MQKLGRVVLRHWRAARLQHVSFLGHSFSLPSFVVPSQCPKCPLPYFIGKSIDICRDEFSSACPKFSTCFREPHLSSTSSVLIILCIILFNPHNHKPQWGTCDSQMINQSPTVLRNWTRLTWACLASKQICLQHSTSSFYPRTWCHSFLTFYPSVPLPPHRGLPPPIIWTCPSTSHL